MSIKAYLIIAALIGGFLLAGIIKHKLDKAEKLTAENTTLKSENKEIKDEAQAFLNRPRTNNDLVDRMCEWRNDLAKAQGLAKRGLPRCRH